MCKMKLFVVMWTGLMQENVSRTRNLMDFPVDDGLGPRIILLQAVKKSLLHPPLSPGASLPQHSPSVSSRSVPAEAPVCKTGTGWWWGTGGPWRGRPDAGRPSSACESSDPGSCSLAQAFWLDRGGLRRGAGKRREVRDLWKRKNNCKGQMWEIWATKPCST